MTHLTTEDGDTKTVVVRRPWASFSSWMAVAATHLGTWSLAALAFMTGALKPLEFGDSELFRNILMVVVLLIVVAVLLTKSELFEIQSEERVVKPSRKYAGPARESGRAPVVEGSEEISQGLKPVADEPAVVVQADGNGGYSSGPKGDRSRGRDSRHQDRQRGGDRRAVIGDQEVVRTDRGEAGPGKPEVASFEIPGDTGKPGGDGSPAPDASADTGGADGGNKLVDA